MTSFGFPRPLLLALLFALFPASSLISGCGGRTATTIATTPTPPVVTPPANSCAVPPVTITHTGGTVAAQQTIFLNTAKYPQAVCNDGTPAAYVFRPGTGAAANRWIVSLEGGGECYDQPTCSARAASSPQLISTAPYAGNPSLVLGLGGMFSATASVNPDFYDANQLHALYCSSDDWSGAKTGKGAFSASDPNTWNFQGRAILAAILADATASRGFGSATEIMLTGDSAGGVGTFANVNDVAKLVPAAARFVAYSDAGFGNNAFNFSATGAPPSYYDSAALSVELAKREPGIVLANAHGDTACAAAATTPAAQVGCYSGAQLLGTGGTITLPMFVSEAQQDTAQLGTEGIPGSALNAGVFTAAQAGYVSYFAAQMRATLATTNAGVSLFSPDALIHVEENVSLFNMPYTFPTTGSLTLQQAIGAWYKAPCTPQRNIAN